MLSRFFRSTAYRDYIKPMALLAILFGSLTIAALVVTAIIVLVHLFIAPYFIWGFPY